MMRIFTLVLVALLFCEINAFAQEADYEATCAKECSSLTKDCTAYIECKVAKTECLSNCMQRKTWENVIKVLEKLTVSLDKQTKLMEEKEKTPQPYYLVQPPQPEIQNTTFQSRPLVQESK
jgi:hypothetical protein